MKQRFYLIVGAIVLLAIIGFGMLVTQPTRKNQVTGQVSVTINYGTGIQEIDVTNQNTGELFQATISNFPLRFNCTADDNLSIKTITKPGYYWNAMWFSPMDIWCKGIDNELTVIAGDGNYFGNVVEKGNIVMTPKCNPTPPTPTPIPTAAPTASPVNWGEPK